MRVAQPGDTIYLVSDDDRTTFIRTLAHDERLETHRGILYYNDLIGLPLGSRVETHLGFEYYMLTPTIEEVVRYIKRNSQIIFPKDIGYILMKLGIQPGSQVLECGTGSGGLCSGLATAVGNEGRVYSYDVRDDMQALARQNLTDIGMAHRVTFKVGDALDGFDETDLDAAFLDIPRPWQALGSARAALRGSGMLGSLVPTNNQLIELIDALQERPDFGFIEAEEIILRSYKTVPARVRPDERMIGHTGFLVFARAVYEEVAE